MLLQCPAREAALLIVTHARFDFDATDVDKDGFITGDEVAHGARPMTGGPGLHSCLQAGY